MFDSWKGGGGAGVVVVVKGGGGGCYLVCRFIIVAQVLEMKWTVTCINWRGIAFVLLWKCTRQFCYRIFFLLYYLTSGHAMEQPSQFITILQSQSKLLGDFTVSSPSQCWCTRIGESSAINNIRSGTGSDEPEVKKRAFGGSVRTIFVWDCICNNIAFFLQELSLFVYFIRSNYSSGICPKCTTRKELQMEPNYDPETDRKWMFQLPGVSRGSGPRPTVRLTYHCWRQCGVCSLSKRRGLLGQAWYIIM